MVASSYWLRDFELKVLDAQLVPIENGRHYS